MTWVQLLTEANPIRDQILFDALRNQVIAVKKLSSLLGVQITGAANEVDHLTINYQYGGDFHLPQGIRFDGGAGGGDVLTIVGAGLEAVTYRPAAAAAGTSVFEVNSDLISMMDVESSILSTAGSLVIQTQGSSDAIQASSSTGYNGATGTKISGSSDGIATIPLIFSLIRAVTIDLSSLDASLAWSNDTLTFAANSFKAAGLRILNVVTGKGDDTLTVDNADLRLPVANGGFAFHGGAGNDRLVVSGDTNLQITGTQVLSAAGGKINFDSIEQATLSGGAGDNLLSAVGFKGSVILHGNGGNDILRAGNFGAVLNGGSGDDQLYGGLGNDRFNGGSGADYYGWLGTARADDLHLQFLSATSANFIRKAVGSAAILAQDSIVYDSSDFFSIKTLGDDDLIAIDLAFTLPGVVDGGDGVDSCTAPDNWTKLSC